MIARMLSTLIALSGMTFGVMSLTDAKSPDSDIGDLVRPVVSVSSNCQAEADALAAANQAFLDAEDAYADAFLDFELAEDALETCESTNPPGSCQSQQDDYNTAASTLLSAEEDLELAALEAIDAQEAYAECQSGGGS